MTWKPRTRKELQQLAERAAKYCRLPPNMAIYVSIHTPAPKWARGRENEIIYGVADDGVRGQKRIGRIWINLRQHKKENIDPALSLFHEVAHLAIWDKVVKIIDEAWANQWERDLYALFEQGVF